MLFSTYMQLGCILSGVIYPGGDIGKATIQESKEKCQKYCQDTSGCLYFTWVDITHTDPSYHKKCYLKKTIVKIKKKEGTYSGPKFCEGNFISLSMFYYYIRYFTKISIKNEYFI